MDPFPFFFDSFADGAVAMTFRAYFLRDADDETMFDVRCIAADPTRDLLERHVSRCALVPFLRSAALRERVVSDTLLHVASVDDAAVALFWTDLVLLRCVEGALRLLRSSSSPRQGVRFSVEFRVPPRRGLRVGYRTIDDVLVLDGSEAGRSVPAEEPARVKRCHDEGRFREKECAICFEEFEEWKDLGRMPCSHTFHYECLDKWLMINLSCPMCRRPID